MIRAVSTGPCTTRWGCRTDATSCPIAPQVREAMRAWRASYGAAPSSYDWSRTHTRRLGGEALKRLRPSPTPERLGVSAVRKRTRACGAGSGRRGGLVTTQAIVTTRLALPGRNGNIRAGGCNGYGPEASDRRRWWPCLSERGKPALAGVLTETSIPTHRLKTAGRRTSSQSRQSKSRSQIRLSSTPALAVQQAYVCGACGSPAGPAG